MLSVILVGLLGLVAAEPTGLDAARRLWQNGRYAEAQEAYEAIAKGPGELAPAVRASIALGRADCLVSQGEPDQAIEDLRKAVDDQPEHPGLWARLADLRLARGDWEGATEAVGRALKVDADHLAARWARPGCLRSGGRASRPSRPGSGSSIGTTSARRRSPRTPMRC